VELENLKSGGKGETYKEAQKAPMMMKTEKQKVPIDEKMP